MWRTRDGRRSITVQDIRETEKKTVKINSKLKFALGDATRTRIQSHVAAIVLKMKAGCNSCLSSGRDNTIFLKEIWLTTRIF
jgi:hypothetical protein